jgi:O-antigen/teichoic acid export membrane protein
MRSVSRNALANAFSRLWSGGMQFVFTPVYVKLLGPEAYGLVGFYGTVLVAMMFLDQCVSPVLTRELGRLGGRDDAAQEMRNLLRSLEVVSIVSGLAVGVAIGLAAPSIAGHWINRGTLSHGEVTNAVRLMGLVIACQWPSNLYFSGFVGLHRQDLATRLRVGIITLQWGGAALLLWQVAPSIELLLAWQAANFLVLSALMGRGLWRLLPEAPTPPRFEVELLRSAWRFAVGTLAIGMTGSLLAQADKLLVSKYAPLDQFAAYSLAFTLASLISILVAQPVASALMPHFSRLMAESDQPGLAREYHRWTQLIVALALPMTGVLAAFGRPLIVLWLGGTSPLIASLLSVLPWVAVGTLVNTVMIVPYVLQIAAGWTRLSVGTNVVGLAIFLPVLAVGVPIWGPLMGSWCWLALNLGNFLFEVPLVHRRLLKGEQWRWWGRDTLLPGAVAALLFGLSAGLAPAGQSPWWGLAQAVVTAGLVLLTLLAILPHPRAQAVALLRRAARTRWP